MHEHIENGGFTVKWRRVGILVILLSLMRSGLIFADAATSKVKLLINGAGIEDGGYLIEGKTYIPVRELDGLTQYNEATKTVTYNKPNVHMFLFTEDGVFGDVKKTGKLKFNVFSQIDNLKVNINAVRVSIIAPNGASKVIQTKEIKGKLDNFWFRTEDFTYDFKATGKYKVAFYMKQGKSFSQVAEKEINVLN